MSWMGPVLVLFGALTNLGTAYVVLRAHNRVLARGREASARAAAHANAAEVSAVAAGAIYAQLVLESDPCCDDGESWAEPTDHVPLPFVAGE